MPVSGRELASLDFANLIGGPLNAVVEAQAKSAITTVNFIKEVAFDKKGKVINVDFSYNRKDDNGKDQRFTLTVPFLTMLPVPYITVSSAVVEFNAKITSTTESKVEDKFSADAKASAGANWWFVSARVQSKTAYQRTSSSSDREERTFDMHVRVEAKNEDMPAGTERILTILEQSIAEKKGPKLVIVHIAKQEGNKLTVEVEDTAADDIDRCINPPKVGDTAGQTTQLSFSALMEGSTDYGEFTVKTFVRGAKELTITPPTNCSLAKSVTDLEIPLP